MSLYKCGRTPNLYLVQAHKYYVGAQAHKHHFGAQAHKYYAQANALYFSNNYIAHTFIIVTNSKSF